MFRSYERRLLEPVESLSDLEGKLIHYPAVYRVVTKATADQLADIRGEAKRAGWRDVEKYDEAFQVLEGGLEELKSRRSELTNSWLISEVLQPAQRLALQGQEIVVRLAEQEKNGRVH